MKSYFPDVNVWIALAYEGHQHHALASTWFDSLHRETAHFCRVTQLGLLRLLTHSKVMQEDVRTQSEAWADYDLLLSDERVSFLPEPEHGQLEVTLRKLTSATRASSKQWPDAYLVAFAGVAGLNLVTFDRGLRQMGGETALLLS
jgi:toxin-antitoxin system PIN domain toxin